MPLVVPGIQSEGGQGIEAWTNKLMGKKIGDDHNETVRPSFLLPSSLLHYPTLGSPSWCERYSKVDKLTCIPQTFAKKDLPEQHRVLQPDSMKTMDFRPERLNIHVDEEGTVKNVQYG